MDITISLICNNNCIFCPRQGYLRIIASHSKEEIFKDIKNIRKRSDEIVLSGGEVTLLKQIWDIIKFCKQNKFKKIGLITNGRALKDIRFAQKMISAGINDFAVSIYSLNDKNHDRITQVKGSCNETKKGILNILKLSNEYGASLRINIVLNSYNYNDIRETLKTLFYLGVRDFIIAEQIIINKRHSFISILKIKEVLQQIIAMPLRDTTICFRGFPYCAFRYKPDYFTGGSIIIKSKDPTIIVERHEINTLEKDNVKKNIYFSKFRDLFSKIDKCKKCFFENECLGFQKAYLQKIPVR